VGNWANGCSNWDVLVLGVRRLGIEFGVEKVGEFDVCRYRHAWAFLLSRRKG
jgi:hypothetical protein